LHNIELEDIFFSLIQQQLLLMQIIALVYETGVAESNGDVIILTESW